MKADKRIASIGVTLAVAGVALIALAVQPQPVSAVSTVSLGSRNPFRQDITGTNGYGCVRVTFLVHINPGETVRAIYLKVAETRDTATQSRIIDGDPIGGNYQADPGWVGTPNAVFGSFSNSPGQDISTPPDVRGNSTHYLGWTVNDQPPFPVGDTSFAYNYCGQKDVSVERNSLILSSNGDTVDDPAAANVIRTLDVHVPTCR